jgi:hypothetical protein
LFLVIFGRNATTIVMIGFVAGLAPVILKRLEALSGTRRALIDQELDADDIDQRKDHSESQSDKDGRQSGRKQDFPEQLAAGQVETAPDIGSSRQTQTKAISKAGARWLGPFFGTASQRSVQRRRSRHANLRESQPLTSPSPSSALPCALSSRPQLF